MPKRSDEWSLIDKDELRYCVRHKHYYLKDFHCQECYLENPNPAPSAEQAGKPSALDYNGITGEVDYGADISP